MAFRVSPHDIVAMNRRLLERASKGDGFISREDEETLPGYVKTCIDTARTTSPGRRVGVDDAHEAVVTRTESIASWSTTSGLDARDARYLSQKEVETIPDEALRDYTKHLWQMALDEKKQAGRGPSTTESILARLGDAERSGGSYLPPKRYLGDADFMQRAVLIRPSLLEVASAGVQRDPSVVLNAVSQEPSMIRHADAALLSDRNFGKRLLELGGEFYQHLAEPLKEDEELLMTALMDDPGAIAYAPHHFREERHLIEYLVERAGIGVLFRLGGSLGDDRDLVLRAVKLPILGMEEIPERLREDPEVLLTAITHNPILFGELSDRLQHESGFVAQLVDANPLVLRFMPEAIRLDQLRDRTALAKDFAQVEHALKELDIEFPERLKSWDTLKEVIRNRQNPRAPEDERPTVLVIFPKIDANRGFLKSDLTPLRSGNRLHYYEAGSDHDLVAICEEVKHKGEVAELLILGAHGNQEVMSFGAKDPVFHPPDTNEELYLDFSDRAQLEPALSGLVPEGAHVVLDSCLTGKGRGRQENVAGFVAEMLPNAHVYAPTVSTWSIIRLDSEGHLVDPGYAGGKAITHVVKPRE